MALGPNLARLDAGRQHAMPAQAADSGHAAVAPGDLKWTPRSPGISAAVVSGSPDKEGAPFVLRLKLAANTRVPPHWHPVDEHLTVLSGTFYMGMGDRFDENLAAALTAGTYAMMPRDVRHFGWTGSETVVQIHGTGPFKTYFVELPAK
jgi:quercetin dioxygenase-like cupin family protein